jgi:[ribosomal protein S5]-alanine N-acetyltransferase
MMTSDHPKLSDVGRQPVLETGRLVLRPYAEADLDPMAAMFGDPDVTAFTFLGRRDREQTAAVLREYMSFLADHGYGMLAIADKASGAYLGEVGLFVSPMGPLALRYALAKSGWGRGYAVEASMAVIDDSFGRLGLESLIAGVKLENKPSLRVMEKLGFRYFDTVAEAGHTFGVFRISRAEGGMRAGAQASVLPGAASITRLPSGSST